MVSEKSKSRERKSGDYLVSGKVGDPKENGYIEVNFDRKYLFVARDKDGKGKVFGINGITAEKKWLKIYTNNNGGYDIPSDDLLWFIARKTEVPIESLSRYISKSRKTRAVKDDSGDLAGLESVIGADSSGSLPSDDDGFFDKYFTDTDEEDLMELSGTDILDPEEGKN